MLATEEKYEASLNKSGDSNTCPLGQKICTKILADGTYASEISDETSKTDSRQTPNIKSKISSFVIIIVTICYYHLLLLSCT